MTENLLGKPGFCIVRDITRPEAAKINALRAVPSALASDGVGRRGAMDVAIRPLDPATRLCGPAITVEVHANDNLMVHAAVAIAEPGDVIVVDGKGDTSAALLGGLLAIGAMKKGVAGFVFDGAVRDGSEMVDAGLPIFCRGVSPVAPDHDGPGQVNVPISCGGVPVDPGDVICADTDGIVVVPMGLIDQTIEAAAKKDAADTARAKEIEAGQINQSWLIPILRKNGVLGPDEEL